MQYLIGYARGQSEIDSTIVEREKLDDAVVLEIEKRIADSVGPTRVFSVTPIGPAKISLQEATRIAREIEKRVLEGETPVFRVVMEALSQAST